MVTLILFLLGVLSLLFLPPSTTAFAAPMLHWWSPVLKFFSHMVSHANWMHLMGNYCFGFPYMMYAEYRLKSWWKYLLLFILCGGVGLVAQLLFDLWVYGFAFGMIGSSAAIFGILSWACWKMDEKWWIRWPARTLALFFLSTQIYNCYLVTRGYGAVVGYAAHSGGILCGMFLALSPSVRRYLSRQTVKLQQYLRSRLSRKQ